MKLMLVHTNSNYVIGLRLPLLSYFHRLGFEVIACAPNMEAGQVRFLRSQGVEGRVCSIDATGINPVKDIANFFRLIFFVFRESPQVVLSNNAKPVIWATLAAALAGVKRRYCLVGGLGYAFTPEAGSASFRRRFVRFVMERLYKCAFCAATAVIFQNTDDRDELVSSGICPATKAHVVSGSGVDVEQFVPAIIQPVHPVFVMVGRLVADKGVREYLHAARIVKQQHPEARFLLVGQIDQNPTSLRTDELAAYVDEGVVEWPGAVRDVRPWLGQANVFVLPSYREGVPRSTLEAMACGLAVITTDAPGCRETVENGRNGILVPVRDVDRLADAMLRLVRDPEQRGTMGRNSREYAERRFDARIVNEDMARIMGFVSVTTGSNGSAA